jgi:hypothetical protein
VLLFGVLAVPAAAVVIVGWRFGARRAIASAGLALMLGLTLSAAVAAPAPPAVELAAAKKKPKPPKNCHPSYKGACVPYASDVDCKGGTGNGPKYAGRVKVVGPDV